MDLPAECVGNVLRFCSLREVLSFSECGRSSDDVAGQDDIWRPLYERRRWAVYADDQNPVTHEWRAAYRRTARLESPLVLQLSSFRCLVGFARDAGPTPAGQLLSPDKVEEAVDSALRVIGLSGVTRPLRGADVIAIIDVLDGEEHAEPILRVLFERGASRVQLADAASAALSDAGVLTGTCLQLDLERVSVACVVDGQRVPLPYKARHVASLRHAVEHLAERAHCRTAPLPSANSDREADEEEAVLSRLASLSSGGMAPSSAPVATGLAHTHAMLDGPAASAISQRAVSAIEAMGGVSEAAGRGSGTAMAPPTPSTDSEVASIGADLAWLLHHHCYVRAVGVSRRPVSQDEAEMSRSALRAPSGRTWEVAEARFMAFERLFVSPECPPITAPARFDPSTEAGAAPPGLCGPSSALGSAPAGGGGGGWDQLAGGPAGSCSSGVGSGGGGAIELLRAAINAAPRTHLPALYSAIVLGGPGGGLPGLRHRLESEMRQIRGDPEMPRTLKPQIRQSMEAAAASGAEGSGGGAVLVRLTAGDAVVWPLSLPETAAWRGTARRACAELGHMLAHQHEQTQPPLRHRLLERRSASAAPTASNANWVLAAQFRREPRYSTRAAMRAAGAPVGGQARNGFKGGHFGGSGIVGQELRSGGWPGQAMRVGATG